MLKKDNKSKIIFLKGDKVFLRPIQKKDINEKYLSWINDTQVTRYTDIGNFPTTLAGLKDFYYEVSKSKKDAMFAIVHQKNNLHIGNIKLGNINWVHRYADLGIVIGDKKYWGKGCGTDACRLLLRYAFEILNLHRVFLGVSALNKYAIRAYKRIGFKIEGRKREVFRINNRFSDEFIMGILQREFFQRQKQQKSRK